MAVTSPPRDLACLRKKKIDPCVPRALSFSAGWIWPYPLDPSSAAHTVLPVVDAWADSYMLPLAAPGCAEDGPLHSWAAPTLAIQLIVKRQLSRQKSVFGGISPTLLAEERNQS